MKTNMLAFFFAVIFTLALMLSIQCGLSEYLALNDPPQDNRYTTALGFVVMAWVFFWMFRVGLDANDRITFLMKHIKRLNDELVELREKLGRATPPHEKNS